MRKTDDDELVKFIIFNGFGTADIDGASSDPMEPNFQLLRVFTRAMCKSKSFNEITKVAPTAFCSHPRRSTQIDIPHSRESLFDA